MIRHIKITVESGRRPGEEYEVDAVPRIGDLVRTRSVAAARVTDVKWDLVSGEVKVIVR